MECIICNYINNNKKQIFLKFTLYFLNIGLDGIVPFEKF